MNKNTAPDSPVTVIAATPFAGHAIPAPAVIRFAVGKTYFMRSPCDHECVWKIKITARTANRVTCTAVGLANTGSEPSSFVRGIKIHNGVETCRPHGAFSMNPILTAERIVAE